MAATASLGSVELNNQIQVQVDGIGRDHLT